MALVLAGQLVDEVEVDVTVATAGDVHESRGGGIPGHRRRRRGPEPPRVRDAVAAHEVQAGGLVDPEPGQAGCEAAMDQVGRVAGHLVGGLARHVDDQGVARDDHVVGVPHAQRETDRVEPRA